MTNANLSNSTLFETATRLKFRFDSVRGPLTVEQLWELPLTNPTAMSLDGVAKEVNRQLKAEGEESFVQSTRNARAEVLAQKLEVVKHVIAVRMAEQKAAEEAHATQQKRQRLLELIAQKDDETLQGKSREDLLKELAELG